MNEEAYNQLEALFRLFREHVLHELKVEEPSFKLHLQRARPAPPARFPGQGLPRRPRRALPPGPEPPSKVRGRTVAVRSPLIGVFYRAPAPEAPPFVEIGDTVQEGQTVCVVEAMKVFNEIKAEWRGRVIAIPAENGKLVQTGEPLVVLEFLEEDREQRES